MARHPGNLGYLDVLAGDMPPALRGYAAPVPTTRPWRRGGRRSRGGPSPGVARCRAVRRGRTRAGQRGVRRQPGKVRGPARRGVGGPCRDGAAGGPRQRGGRPRPPGAGGVPAPPQRPARRAGRAGGVAGRGGRPRPPEVDWRGRAQALASRLDRLGWSKTAESPVSSPPGPVVDGPVGAANGSSPARAAPPRRTARHAAVTTADPSRPRRRRDRAETARQLIAGMATRHRTAPGSAASTYRPAPRVHGPNWPGPVSARRWRPGRRPRSTAGRSGPGPGDAAAAGTPAGGSGRRGRARGTAPGTQRCARPSWPAGPRAAAPAPRAERTMREHSWSAAGPGEGAGPGRAGVAPAGPLRTRRRRPRRYGRAGQALHALVVAAGRSPSRRSAGTPAEEALLRLRADLDAPAGRALPRGSRTRSPPRPPGTPIG